MRSQTAKHADRVIQAATSDAAAASALAASWRRSLLNYGLDPSRRRARTRLQERNLRVKLEECGDLLQASAESLDWLHDLIGSTGCGVFLTNAAGIVLAVRCDGIAADLFQHNDLWLGADWSEASEGTNGIGTCLAEQRQVTIHRDQHFLTCHTSLSCIDAPIFLPNGDLAGALDVSTARLDHDPKMNSIILATVLQAVRRIESKLFRTTFHEHRIVIPEMSTDDPSALLAVDDDDLVVGATRAARKLVGLPKSGAFAAVPYRDIHGSRRRQNDLQGFARGEKAAIIRALSRTRGNVSQAARDLGVGRATLYRRMNRLNIETRGESAGSMSRD